MMNFEFGHSALNLLKWGKTTSHICSGTGHIIWVGSSVLDLDVVVRSSTDVDASLLSVGMSDVDVDTFSTLLSSVLVVTSLTVSLVGAADWYSFISFIID